MYEDYLEQTDFTAVELLKTVFCIYYRYLICNIYLQLLQKHLRWNFLAEVIWTPTQPSLADAGKSFSVSGSLLRAFEAKINLHRIHKTPYVHDNIHVLDVKQTKVSEWVQSTISEDLFFVNLF